MLWEVSKVLDGLFEQKRNPSEEGSSEEPDKRWLLQTKARAKALETASFGQGLEERARRGREKAQNTAGQGLRGRASSPRSELCQGRAVRAA
jgi:hypothetical protein